MSKSTDEIEDEVRAVLLKAQRELDNSWGDIYFGRAKMPPHWQETYEAMVAQAVAQARKIMADNQLEAKSVAVFEHYRIAELEQGMKDAVHRLAFKATQPEPDPEPQLSELQRKLLKSTVDTFIKNLQNKSLPDLPPAEALQAMREVEDESRKQWQAMRPRLDLDMELQQESYERWQAELRRLSQECGRTRHLAAKFEKILVSDLPSSAKPQAKLTGDASGLFYEVYRDGQVRRIVSYRKGSDMESLELSHGKAYGKWEDSANVAEFHPDNSLDEYGGRYERESRYPGTFRDWVLECIRKMSENAQLG